jgi:hypothetical protein
VSVSPPAARSSSHPPPTIRRLSGPECRSWLGERRFGRLGHQTGRGLRAVVVNYAVTDDQIVFRLPEYSEICQYAPGREITLDVSCVCAGTRTEVVVTGVGFDPDHRADLLGSVDLVEEWPPGISTHLICLDLAVVEGTRGVRSGDVGSGAG